MQQNRADAIWQDIIDGLRADVSAVSIAAFFDGSYGVDLTSDSFYAGVTGNVSRDWIVKNHKALIEERLAALLGSPRELVCLAGEAEVRKYNAAKKQAETTNGNGEARHAGAAFTFDNFVVGSSNRFAHAAAEAVASGTAAGYNPLFIYGGSGLGKTHLLYAIANSRRASDRQHKIIYTRGEEFANELINVIREGRIRGGENENRANEFRDKYRYVDLLLMDDIHFIAGKDATQEEFFNTFNSLYEAGKQIVVTSDRPPKDMARLEERLRTRFEWGVVCDIQPPDLETRFVIIKNKAASLGLTLPDDMVIFIAENITSNVRQLEGAVKKLQAYVTLLNQPLTIETAQTAIRDIISEKKEPNGDLIIEKTERFYNLEPGSLSSKRRDSRTAKARQVSVYLIRTMTTLSFPEIGRLLGRHHSTIMYSVDQIAEERGKDRRLDSEINDIVTDIEG